MGSELGNTPDTKPVARFDGVGIFYTVVTIVWTIMLFSGIAYLYTKREMQALRIRGLPLAIGSVVFLHAYWIAVTLGYVYGALMPEVAEYFIMGLWLPSGVALFHAANTRFLYVAQAQKKFARKTREPYRIYARHTTRLSLRESIKVWWSELDYANKTLLTVAVGIMFQMFLTLFMFLISRKFHSSWGIPGTEVTGTPMEIKSKQGTGWEWWPSVFWQFFWAWIVAPMILWRSRKIHDTQGWRIQTIGCCLASLHATPMWLIALYAPGMAPVNNYWIPPQWIALSIMIMEIFTIFVPCWEVSKQRALCQETLESIARWESRQRFGAKNDAKSLNSDISGSTWASRMGRATSIHTGSGGSILTMDALEHTLEKNPEPLQEFSALRDFSGENVAFLMRIRDWRLAHFPNIKKGAEKDSVTSVTMTRECFEGGLHIYLDFISATSAEFQVNLSSQDFRKLQEIFEVAAQAVCGAAASPDPATPFDDAPRSTAEVLKYDGEIPTNFDQNVFDDAEVSIKYLVLTNTWPKFIKQRRSFDATSNAETV